MTTVLEALREQQQRAGSTSEPVPPRKTHNWWPRWPWLVVVPVIVAAVLIVFLRHREASRAISSATAPPTHRPAAPERRAAAAAPAMPSSALGELPWGHIGQERAAPAAVPMAAPTRPHLGPPAKAQAKPAIAHTDAAVPPLVPGDAGIRVQSIRYTPDSTKRTATLWIGGTATTLHEGESARDVEVQLILPDMVYVRRGGSVFAIAGSR